MMFDDAVQRQWARQRLGVRPVDGCWRDRKLNWKRRKLSGGAAGIAPNPHETAQEDRQHPPNAETRYRQLVANLERLPQRYVAEARQELKA